MKVDQLIILLLIFAGYCCNLEAQKINELSFVASDNAIGDKEVEPVIRVHANIRFLDAVWIYEISF